MKSGIKKLALPKIKNPKLPWPKLKQPKMPKIGFGNLSRSKKGRFDPNL